ncbi:GntR family transcriptional regulator [Nesterenkonia ebinurensis]|uniref:GntR family transcriptional regulator n=1 Tax=Nesterenkonia ebinurensis TaxID=2608252 RepID=UPI00123E34C4|nr:GntR family transcriptional regulator [Nesterenkonia ebinurensis]
MSDSMASAVTKKIRADIIRGVLKPGQRLREAFLAERYEVSRIPIRESLRSLSTEGLVDIRPYAGAAVAEIPEDDAEDLFDIRIELEGATARRAAIRAQEQVKRGAPDGTWWTVRREIGEILSEGESAISANQLDRLIDLNMRFHQSIARLSDSPSLLALIEQISGRIELLYAMNVIDRGRESWFEHHDVIAKIDAGDEKAARALMRRHVERSKDCYFEALSPSVYAEESPSSA